jgi:hypothetical protein
MLVSYKSKCHLEMPHRVRVITNATRMIRVSEVKLGRFDVHLNERVCGSRREVRCFTGSGEKNDGHLLPAATGI